MGILLVSAQAQIRPRGIHLTLFDRPEDASPSENVISNHGVWSEHRRWKPM